MVLVVQWLVCARMEHPVITLVERAVAPMAGVGHSATNHVLEDFSDQSATEFAVARTKHVVIM